MDFDELEEQELDNPNSMASRLQEWETTGEWRDPKVERRLKAKLAAMEKEREEMDAEAKVKAEQRRQRREDKQAKEAKKLAAKGGVKKARRIRVLCLHGVGGSKALWATQAKRLLTAFEKEEIECITLEGQEDCTSTEAVENLEVFFGKKDPKLQYAECEFDERNWITYEDNEEVLDWMQDELASLAPIDGIIGFAQGANFAAMLAGQSAIGEGEPLSFVCLISPNAPGYARPLQRLFQEKITVPTMIVWGEQETYDVGMGMSTFLAGKPIEKCGKEAPSDHVKEFFQDPEVFTHSGSWSICAPGKEAEEQLGKMVEFVKTHAKP
uniref:Serine hydrolase domain-containing protein n=1 Tax=Alexandrium catenella TaxID=2925 RepID=A0A7S1SAW1_ALECA|mmetsp:Transcript_90966/g.241611  ORF Transcript_90966/g.241611 Transcript_90966/m.241611 type:complete len:325 (+) Transcript_90966:69-1043(+)